jgi:hypothetical protein
MSTQPTPSKRFIPHSLLEDVLAILTGTLFVSLGIALFNQAGLLTGGTAGLAFLIHYRTGLSFGSVFFLVNLPFYWLASNVWAGVLRSRLLLGRVGVFIFRAASETGTSGRCEYADAVLCCPDWWLTDGRWIYRFVPPSGQPWRD